MTDAVDETLKEWRQTSFEWGQRDCLLSVADYASGRGVFDVHSWFRGSYTDRAGAEAILDAHGGIAALIDLSGLLRIDPATIQRGDVVVIDPRDGIERHGMAGICTGPGIALRAERSVMEISTRLITVKFAWSMQNVGRR